ncbi:2-hydroxyacid dehydrogenase [Motiliproteus sp. SC1-56]|uniref:2-hydroxyacid dehydrogenase n=1 Tax=Motiliproteus sp. SC1-56 TaxID=2799565 RepID=UPI001A903A2C|nr:2-hydroxyacid dehydrogenase [Motiliproteus sp. SC1-56]
MKTVFLDAASLDFDDLDMGPLRNVASPWVRYEATEPDEVLERVRDAQVIISNKVVLDADTLAACPALQLICVAATGTNNVDLQAARNQGIRVSNCQAYGTAAVAQHVLGLMLALATRLLDYERAVRAGAWQKSPRFCLLDYPIMELAGKTLGIVGYGELGRAVARLGEALGMRVLVAQRPGTESPAQGRLPLAELLAQVDVLSLHTPLTEATRDLIGAEELARMRPGALLINAARGGIVDEQALAEALRSGHLGGAGVDVLSQEPPREGNPLLAGDVPNLIVTPHSAWGSLEARQRIVDQLAENIAAFVAGSPQRVVA